MPDEKIIEELKQHLGNYISGSTLYSDPAHKGSTTASVIKNLREKLGRRLEISEIEEIFNDLKDIHKNDKDLKEKFYSFIRVFNK